MTKIREILEKYAQIDGYLKVHGFAAEDCKIIWYEDFGKLEEELQELIKEAIKEERKKRFKNKNDVIGIYDT